MSKQQDVLTIHEGQRDVLESEAHTKVVAAGRRWGKTTLSVKAALEYADEHDGSTTWYVTYLHDAALKALETALEFDYTVRVVQQTRLRIELKNGSEVYFSRIPPWTQKRPWHKSTNKTADYLVLDDVVVDRKGERAAKQEVKSLIKAAEEDGEPVDGILVCGTPHPRDPDDDPRWFETLWNACDMLPSLFAESFRFATLDAPSVDAASFEDATEMIGAEKVESEFHGKFTGDSDG